MGSPSTLNMRPSTFSPTGTEMGPPMERTSIPRPMPSLGESMKQRTVPAHVLGHLHDPALAAGLQPQGVLDGGELPLGELYVNDRALYLGHRPFAFL